jgi:hypothetical protein
LPVEKSIEPALLQLDDWVAVHELGSYVHETPSESLKVPPLAASWLEIEKVMLRLAPAVQVRHVAGVTTPSVHVPDGQKEVPPLLLTPPLLLVLVPDGHEE